MNIPNSIDKKFLVTFVNNKINHVVKYYHVYGIVCILFEELLEDLKNGKIIKIKNLGSIYLRQNKPKKYFDVRMQQVMQSAGNKKMLKFILSSRLKKKICKELDIDKTFRNE